MRPSPRSRAQRKADTLALLRTEVDCWVAPITGTARRSSSGLRARLRPRRTSCVTASHASASVRRARSCSSTEGVDDATTDAHTEISERTPPGIVTLLSFPVVAVSRAARTRKLDKRLHTQRTFDREQVDLNEKAPISGAFAEPSDGLEPSTPSLPWNVARNR